MKVSPSAVVNAIPVAQIGHFVDPTLAPLREALIEMLTKFCAGPTASKTLDLEQAMFANLLEAGRCVLEAVFNSLEKDEDNQPPVICHRENNYRRLPDRKPREVVTRFGKIKVMRARYRRGRKGKLIFPLEIVLGLQRGFTPAAASLVGQQFAGTGSSQTRTIDFAKQYLGSTIGPERLRKLSQHLAEQMQSFQHDCQRDELQRLLNEAEKSGAKSIVLSVSRDAVSLGIAPFGFFEMASVATLSVLADGKRLGTVYLGRTPETNQKTLSDQLTKLLRATLQAHTKRPQIVYVTDAGKVETAYWHNVLSKFYVEGKRIKIHRVVDYYHASERLTVLADSIKFSSKAARRKWLERVRRVLLDPKGHGRVMRSVAAVRCQHGVKISKSEDFEKAVNYLNNQKRYMKYDQMRSQSFPIGSGVVESACKQIVSERMKLSGMRWKKAGAQAVMTLRCILLSNIWDRVFGRMLNQNQPVDEIINSQASVSPASVGA